MTNVVTLDGGLIDISFLLFYTLQNFSFSIMCMIRERQEAFLKKYNNSYF